MGSHFAERLVREGCRVRVIDNFSTGRRSNLAALADDVELVEGDLQSYGRVRLKIWRKQKGKATVGVALDNQAEFDVFRIKR